MDRRTFCKLGTLAALPLGLGALSRGTKAAGAEAEHFAVTKTDAEWRRLLTPEQYRILRAHGTERPESSPLDHETRKGTYDCAGCAQALFSSAAKYDSGTGWPSFWQPLDGAIGTRVDNSFFMHRTEVHCSRCGGHLGHVFNDGPKPTGLRYCMNGAALSFAPAASA
jgi:peptide-methionine (R)-S-oxide reductase